MIKQPFTPRDLLNSQNLKIMTRVSEMFESATRGDYFLRQSVVLEGLGTWIEQSDWTDRTGYYMTIRLAPLDKGRPVARELGRTLLDKFSGLIPGSANVSTLLNGEGLDEGEQVTVKVHSSTYSIGD